MAGELPQDPPQGQLLIYQDGSLNLQVRLDGQTVWLPQRLIAELFQVSVKTASEHLMNIYSEGELGREATIRSFRIVQREGSRDVARQVEHYSLDATLAVGYRVRSARGTAFRQWATARLSELLAKGFTKAQSSNGGVGGRSSFLRSGREVSSRGFTGSAVEQAALALIESAGWSVRRGLEILSGESKADRIIGRVC